MEITPLRLIPMTQTLAKDIASWTYEGEYALYSFEQTNETVNELTNGEYFACLDGANACIGYICYGASARIPTLEANVYDADALDIGLGLRPELCGHGLGENLLRAGLYNARTCRGAARFRLSVAAFNTRAIRLYEKAGFTLVAEITHRATHMRFLLMQYP